MSPSTKSLQTLDHRLRTLVQSSNTLYNDVSLWKARYICSECSYATFHLNTLAAHSTQHSAVSIPCPEEDCLLKFRSQSSRDSHWRQRHAFLGDFQTKASLQQGCPENTDHPNDSRAFERHDQSVHSLSQGFHQNIEQYSQPLAHLGVNHSSDSKAEIAGLRCPHRGCEQEFPTEMMLYDHYVGLHPLSIIIPGKHKPFKCPFCNKRYHKERYMKGHQKEKHGRHRRDTVCEEAFIDQQMLFRQARQSMVRRASEWVKVIPADEEDTSSEDTSSLIKDEEVELDNLQDVPRNQDCDYPVTTRNGIVYIDDDVGSATTDSAMLSSFQKQEPFTDVKQEDVSLHDASGYISPFHAQLIIGFELQDPSVDHERTLTDEDYDADDEYPEAFALEEHELPQEPHKPHTANQIPSEDLTLRIFRWLLTLLSLDNYLGLSEVLSLWSSFFTPPQQTHTFHDLHTIILLPSDQDLYLLHPTVTALHATLFAKTLSAYTNLKHSILLPPPFIPRLPKQHPHLIVKATAYALLRYCTALEHLIAQARPIAREHGLPFPVNEVLRKPPLDVYDITLDADLPVLFEAMRKRVACRIVRELGEPGETGEGMGDDGIHGFRDLENLRVLQDVGKYVTDLELGLMGLVPSVTDRDGLWRRFFGVV